MKYILTLVLLAVVSILPLRAQDAEGCSDHQFFTRLPNFNIGECQVNFNSIDMQTGKGDKAQTVEGNVTKIVYGFDAESGAKMPSPLQIVKNYENAIIAKGGKVTYKGEDYTGGPMAGVFQMSKDGKDYWVTVRGMYEPQTNGEVGSYILFVVEMEAMKQDVEAKEMFEKLSNEGKIALYINFETGKSAIQPSSQNIVDQIAAMMNANSSLRISIEGHTDNTGTAAANQKLSESRAAAVMSALVDKGINKGRLTSVGWGQSKPVAGNDTEEGKAKNRRVEIVKQ